MELSRTSCNLSLYNKKFPSKERTQQQSPSLSHKYRDEVYRRSKVLGPTSLSGINPVR